MVFGFCPAALTCQECFIRGRDEQTSEITWENAALFDFDWAALPAWEAFSAL
jgi:hypothetical protein